MTFAAVMPEVARLAAARLESGKFDPAPARAVPSTLVNSRRSPIYGTAFGHPVETRSAEKIIPPIASRFSGVPHLVGRRLAPESYPVIFAERGGWALFSDVYS